VLLKDPGAVVEVAELLKVARITIEDVRAWPDDLGVLRCESGCTALTAIAGPDGWPLERGDVW